MQLIGLPLLRVSLHVLPNGLQGCFVTNDAIIIILLPYGDAGGISRLIDTFSGDGFESGDE